MNILRLKAADDGVDVRVNLDNVTTYSPSTVIQDGTLITFTSGKALHVRQSPEFIDKSVLAVYQKGGNEKHGKSTANGL